MTGRMKSGVAVMLLLAGLAGCRPEAVAAPATPGGAAEKDKIEALIKVVEGLKDAKFVRNGSAYDGATAGEFMRSKWNTNKEQVKTAEDFIRVCATTSTTTGLPYLIRFADGREIKSGEFLTAELEKMGNK